MHRSKNRSLLDHLVGGGEQLIGNGEAERLRGLEIEHQLEFSRTLNRQIRGFSPLRIRSIYDADLPIMPRKRAHRTVDRHRWRSNGWRISSAADAERSTQ